MARSILHLILAASATLVGATPPGIPSASVAQTQLDALTVGTGASSGYDRDLFNHWINQGDGCNTRELVLVRDGTNVQTDSACRSTSGSWYSEYDGDTWTQASDVDIDHVVPLANAWRSGASDWTDDEREAFANDLSIPQLIAVTDNVNQAKSDAGPEEWLPPLTSYHCTYGRMWINVKYTYGLMVNSAEKSALQDLLATC
ncbi:hypothetical protein BJY04DRAFT_217585 [Aspergillus karnatakaensis]|uniref:HNH endonuclease family protein n=1 Tax=Aspergillus karnatakaensis TaxID=1810916 RepID=UPI003CCE3C70